MAFLPFAFPGYVRFVFLVFRFVCCPSFCDDRSHRPEREPDAEFQYGRNKWHHRDEFFGKTRKTSFECQSGTPSKDDPVQTAKITVRASKSMGSKNTAIASCRLVRKLIIHPVRNSNVHFVKATMPRVIQ